MNFSQNKSQHANNSIRTWLLCQSVSFHFLLERKGITEQHGGIMQVLDQVVQPFFQYIEQRKQLLNFGVLRQLYLETQSLGSVRANQFTLIYLFVHFLIHGVAAQYSFTQYNPRYSTILNCTKQYKFPGIVCFFAFFPKKKTF